MTTTLTATAAAGLSALAVTVAAPAADEGGKEVVHERGPTPEALVACLADHGATGMPAPDANGGRALKEWIVAHQGDDADRAALRACDVFFGDKVTTTARACPAPAPGDPAPPDDAAKAKRLRGGGDGA